MRFLSPRDWSAPWQVWSPSRRPIVLAGLAVLLAVLGWARWRSPVALPDPPGDGARAGELAVRLDPNTADVGALSALPGLGMAKARAIVDYRVAYLARHPSRTAFVSARDLLPIQGIGVGTVENLRPYLTFPTADP